MDTIGHDSEALLLGVAWRLVRYMLAEYGIYTMFPTVRLATDYPVVPYVVRVPIDWKIVWPTYLDWWTDRHMGREDDAVRSEVNLLGLLRTYAQRPIYAFVEELLVGFPDDERLLSLAARPTLEIHARVATLELRLNLLRPSSTTTLISLLSQKVDGEEPFRGDW